jgi:hypothetical protein
MLRATGPSPHPGLSRGSLVGCDLLREKKQLYTRFSSVCCQVNETTVLVSHSRSRDRGTCPQFMRFEPGRRRPESKRIASKQSKHNAGRTGLALASKCRRRNKHVIRCDLHGPPPRREERSTPHLFLKLLQGIPRPRLSITMSDAELTSTLRCRRTVSVCTFRNAQSARTLRLLCAHPNAYARPRDRHSVH